MIKFEEFMKLDIRIGKIISAEKVEATDKLMKLEVDLGNEKRQLVAGIAEYYNPEEIIGKKTPVLTNLEPKTFKGIESQGMILAVDVNNEPVLLLPEKDVPEGSKVR